MRRLAAAILLAACGGKAAASESAPARSEPEPILCDPPDAPSDASIARMTGYRQRACACLDPACVDALELDFTDFREEDTCPLANEAEEAQFGAEYDLMEACKAVVAEGTYGIPGCEVFVGAMERYLACDKIPQATRDAARQGLDAMKQGWGDVRDLPPDVVFDTAEACVSSVRALEAGAAELGCAP